MKINPRLIFYILVANLIMLMFANKIDLPILFISIVLLNFFIASLYPIFLILSKLKVGRYLSLASSFLLTAILFYIISTVNDSINTALFILFLINIFSISVAFVN